MYESYRLVCLYACTCVCLSYSSSIYDVRRAAAGRATSRHEAVWFKLLKSMNDTIVSIFQFHAISPPLPGFYENSANLEENLIIRASVFTFFLVCVNLHLYTIIHITERKFFKHQSRIILLRCMYRKGAVTGSAAVVGFFRVACCTKTYTHAYFLLIKKFIPIRLYYVL